MAQLPMKRHQGGRLATREDNPIEQLRRNFDNLFGRMWGGMLAPYEQSLEPLRIWDFDITDNDKEFIVRAELPGFEPNEIDIQLDNNVLTIRAEEEQRAAGSEEYRRFVRSVSLPPAIDADNAQANYRNGVLELRIPRSAEAQAKHIKVQGHQESKAAPGQSSSAGTNESTPAETPKGT